MATSVPQPSVTSGAEPSPDADPLDVGSREPRMPAAEPSEVILPPPFETATFGEVGSTPGTELVGRPAHRNPTCAADGGRLGALWVAAASVAGLRHQQEGTSGQDAYSFAISDDGTTFAVSVADGLGSRPNSQVGSAVVARDACERLVAEQDDANFEMPVEFAQSVAAAVNLRLRQYRSERHPGWDDRDLGTTLAFAWIRKAEQGWHAIIGRIGDADAFVLDGDRWDSPFERGDSALNAVDQNLPTTNGRAPEPEAATVDLAPGTVMVLTTDGMSEDLRSSPATRDTLADAWRSGLTAVDMLRSVSYRRRGSHDDRTAIAVWLPTDQEAGEADPIAHKPAPDSADDDGAGIDDATPFYRSLAAEQSARGADPSTPGPAAAEDGGATAFDRDDEPPTEETGADRAAIDDEEAGSGTTRRSGIGRWRR